VPQLAHTEVVMSGRLLLVVVASLGVAGCTDASHPATQSIVAPERSMSEIGAAANDRLTASGLWNKRTRAIIGRQGGSSPKAARTFALVSVAQYDAVIAAGEAGRDPRERQRGVRRGEPLDPRPRAADDRRPLRRLRGRAARHQPLRPHALRRRRRPDRVGRAPLERRPPRPALSRAAPRS